MRFLPLILQNVLRNRRRSVLTILSIGVSLCLLGVLMALYNAFYLSDPPPSQALRLVTRNRVSLGVTMPAYYRDQIRRLPGVKEVMTSNWFGGIYKDSRDPKNFFARFAVEPDYLLAVRYDMQLGEEERRAFRTERQACILGRPLAERLGIKLNERLTLKGDIYPVTLELIVRGIYDASENNENFYFHNEYLQESIAEVRRNQATVFVTLAESAEAVPRVIRAIDGMFRGSPSETKTESEQAFQLAFISSLGNVKMFLLSISAAVTFTILLVSANTMAMSVRERVREVGVLKTLGYSTEAILGIILAESALIALAGGALGLALSGFLCAAIRRAPAVLGQLKTLTMEPQVMAAVLLAALLIGTASSLAPAWGASRTTIIDALRSTE